VSAPELPPAVTKVLLGLELSRQREAAGATQTAAAEVLRCSQQKIAHIESGSGIRPLELDGLMDLYGTTDADRTYTLDLQRGANRRTKRNAFSTRFDPNLRLLIEMEATCQTYRSYRGMVLPGLLQIEDYTRSVLRAWRPSPTQEKIDRDTENRLARQRVLDDAERSFWFIVDEAALRRMVGTPEVMANQLDHLIALADRPNVELQVVPFDAGFYFGSAHDLTIFGYQARVAVQVVYLEHYDSDAYVQDPKRTAQYLSLWDHLMAAASGPEQSRRLLARLRGSL
jgi:Domain of unknown function (DUF5753)/Helix-turn-helix domain